MFLQRDCAAAAGRNTILCDYGEFPDSVFEPANRARNRSIQADPALQLAQPELGKRCRRLALRGQKPTRIKSRSLGDGVLPLGRAAYAAGLSATSERLRGEPVSGVDEIGKFALKSEHVRGRFASHGQRVGMLLLESRDLR